MVINYPSFVRFAVTTFAATLLDLSGSYNITVIWASLGDVCNDGSGWGIAGGYSAS
jgi:hypothetical protein